MLVASSCSVSVPDIVREIWFLGPHIATDVARSVVNTYLCWSHECAVHKTGEPIKMPFGELTLLDPRHRALNRIKFRRIHSQPRGVTSQ